MREIKIGPIILEVETAKETWTKKSWAKFFEEDGVTFIIVYLFIWFIGILGVGYGMPESSTLKDIIIVLWGVLNPITIGFLVSRLPRWLTKESEEEEGEEEVK